MNTGAVLHAFSNSSVIGIFWSLWRIAIQWKSSDISLADQDDCRVSLFSELLSKSDENEICRNLETYANQYIPKANHNLARGIILDIISAIDYKFYDIHPRRLKLSIIESKPVCEWLKKYQSLRRDSGAYAENEYERVIPKGPLSKAPRSEIASNAICLEDSLSYLAVARVSHELTGRRISTVTSCVTKSGVHGYSAEGGKAERISVLPIAEKIEQIKIQCISRNNNHFAHYDAASPDTIVETVISTLNVDSQHETTIAVAPELLINSAAADKISANYGEVSTPPRLFISGSGHSFEKYNDQSWNESRAFNNVGFELWRQQKIWPAGLTQSRALKFKLSDPGNNKLLIEDNCSGDNLIIVDIDGLGRCLTLICQDFEATSLAETVIREYQPDWIFVPILDSGVDLNRWGHHRAFSLSKLSQARFVIASSTALCSFYRSAQTAEEEPTADPCALLVGPKISEEEDSRVYKVLSVSDETETRSISITWDMKDKNWKPANLS